MSNTPPGAASIHHLHARFLAILPRIERHGRVYFRYLRPIHREEAVAEMVALSWKWFLSLVNRGKDPARFPSALAGYAARAVRAGRRVCGQEKAKDVLSPSAQRCHNFVVTKLPDCSTLAGNPLEVALQDNTRTPVPEAAAFRIDFPAWLATWDERRRNMITDLAQGERTQDLADKYGVSPGRISQLRREYQIDWTRYTDQAPLAE